MSNTEQRMAAASVRELSQNEVQIVAGGVGPRTAQSEAGSPPPPPPPKWTGQARTSFRYVERRTKKAGQQRPRIDSAGARRRSWRFSVCHRSSHSQDVAYFAAIFLSRALLLCRRRRRPNRRRRLVNERQVRVAMQGDAGIRAEATRMSFGRHGNVPRSLTQTVEVKNVEG